MYRYTYPETTMGVTIVPVATHIFYDTKKWRAIVKISGNVTPHLHITSETTYVNFTFHALNIHPPNPLVLLPQQYCTKYCIVLISYHIINQLHISNHAFDQCYFRTFFPLFYDLCSCGSKIVSSRCGIKCVGERLPMFCYGMYVTPPTYL